MNLDEVDRELLSLVQAGARSTLAKPASRVNLSDPAVKRRTDRLAGDLDALELIRVRDLEDLKRVVDVMRRRGAGAKRSSEPRRPSDAIRLKHGRMDSDDPQWCGRDRYR